MFNNNIEHFENVNEADEKEITWENKIRKSKQVFRRKFVYLP